MRNPFRWISRYPEVIPPAVMMYFHRPLSLRQETIDF
jgi:hypothetical protein